MDQGKPLEGKVALVTGAAVGVGRATAVKMGSLGAAVAVNYGHSAADAQETKRLVEATGARCVVVKADVTDDAQIRAMVKSVVDQLGRIDVLVNNAAVTKFAAFEDLEGIVPEDWTRMFDTNVRGVFQVCRAVAPVMKAQGAGRIVNLSSTSSLRPIGSSIPYSVSKAAVNHLTMCLAKALGPEISVNAICPGTIVGTRWHENPREASFPRPADPGKLNPKEVGKGRPATPEDIAGVIASMVTGTDWISGAIILADGARGFA